MVTSQSEQVTVYNVPSTHQIITKHWYSYYKSRTEKLKKHLQKVRAAKIQHGQQGCKQIDGYGSLSADERKKHSVVKKKLQEHEGNHESFKPRLPYDRFKWY